MSASPRSSAGSARPAGTLASRIDFFCTTDGPAPFATEIATIADTRSGLRVHLHDSATDGFLSPGRILDAIDGEDPRQVSVFLCGPAPMVDTFIRRLRTAGIPARNVHREHFHWR